MDNLNCACVSARPSRPHDSDLDLRVAAEFREMPGLRVTLLQAARLFSLDAVACRGVLDALVSKGVLSAEAGVFQSSGAGRRDA